jgi:hypothetical protein
MYSINTYNGTGVAAPYAVTFPYLSKDHVEIRIGGVLITTGFSWINSSTLSFAAPVGTGNVEIRRNTPKNVAQVTYSDGSTLTDSDMNLETLHLMYITQEAYDTITVTATDTLGSAASSAAAYADAHDAVTLAAAAVQAANLVNSIAPPVFQAWLPTILADGPDYTSGTSTSVTLPASESTGARTLMAVIFDGIVQGDYTLGGDNVTLSFSSAIPAGVKKITVWYAAAFNLGSFIQEGSGSCPRSFQSKMRDYVNVKDFGAKGDGVTDDTAAFLAAIATGKKVEAGEGTFLTSQIVWPDKAVFRGHGVRTIIKPCVGFSTNAFWVIAAGATNADIGNFEMDLPVANFAATVPLFALQGSRHHFHDIYMPSGGNIGVFLIDNTDTLIENCHVASSQQHSFQSTGLNSARNKIVRCYSGTTVSGHGISIIAGMDHDVLDCVSSGAQGFGISYYQTLRGRACRNRSGNSYAEGMQITDSNWVIFADNTLSWDTPGVSTDLGISLAAQTTGFSCVGNKIQGNFITGNSASGIALASTNYGTGTTPIIGPGLPVQDNVISHNTIINCSVDTTGGLLSGRCAGILLYGSQCQYNNVQDNKVLNNIGTLLHGVAEYDVSAAWGTPSNNRIVNNSVRGESVSKVLKSGTTNESLTSGILAYTATLGAATGSLTSANVLSAFYYEIEQRIDVTIQIQITTNGTAGGAVTFTLPRSAQVGFGTGRATSVSGKQLVVTCAGATASIRNSDGSYPGANGETLEVMCSFFR